jgi:hypothetical protein
MDKKRMILWIATMILIVASAIIIAVGFSVPNCFPCEKHESICFENNTFVDCTVHHTLNITSCAYYSNVCEHYINNILNRF